MNEQTYQYQNLFSMFINTVIKSNIIYVFTADLEFFTYQNAVQWGLAKKNEHEPDNILRIWLTNKTSNGFCILVFATTRSGTWSSFSESKKGHLRILKHMYVKYLCQRL